MVVKIVRYLTQQGYGTDKIVVLVPYLAQLRDLRDALKKGNGSTINDLDSYDLYRAGVPPAANASRKAILCASIDGLSLVCRVITGVYIVDSDKKRFEF